MSGLCRYPYFQVSTLTGSTVFVNYQYFCCINGSLFCATTSGKTNCKISAKPKIIIRNDVVIFDA